jgi:hypothetical protein
LSTLALNEGALGRFRDTVRRGARYVESLPAARVLATFVFVEWIAILATARVVRHAGWIYYQGGDQLWYYTLGWALGHGHITQTPVGYLWSVLIAPIALVAGPNLVSAFPAIILLNVLVLMPVAMLALYGIAVRIGGRLFGYWALLLWIVVPFIGVLYTNQGYHQKYTELLLPQAFGLTGMADFPTTVAALVSVYFCVRALTSARAELFDALAAGVAGGAAVAIKPATALYLAGPVVAIAYRRRPVVAGGMLLGFVPFLAALAVWKERGLGQIPVLSHSAPAGGLAAAQPVAALNFGKYFHQVDWSHFLLNLDLIREHFFSNRLIEWLVIGGLIGLLRRSRTLGLLVGVWFAAFAIVKGGYAGASIEDGSLFRIMMPVYPAFLLLLASVPFLLPHAPAALREYTPTLRRPSPRTRWALLGAVTALTSVVPLAAFAAASRGPGVDPTTIAATAMPIPGNIDLGVTASVHGNHVTLHWRSQRPLGGPVFFRIRRGMKEAFTCSTGPGARICNIDGNNLPEVGTTHADEFVDRPGPGRWTYRVEVAANWLNDVGFGDPYLVSGPVSVAVR